ncbi:hypothetical protein [Nocardia tengchongensis]|uniref:hypothetical protein n=1 Tax=Nocardia tengchongensis TaxID=2055889 RepID=UPI0036D2A021
MIEADLPFSTCNRRPARSLSRPPGRLGRSPPKWISPAPLASAWLNCRLRGIDIKLPDDFRKVLPGRTFDVLLRNPP